jgi:phosphoglycerol transferase MdoB-like AlkP superfamily enzyme
MKAGMRMDGQNNEVISVKNWILTMIILAIPLINIIMLFVWSFSGNVNPNKKNYSRATLILLAIALVLSILFVVLSNKGGA